MIELKGITKSYMQGFSRHFILRNVSLEIPQGSFVSIMGPSGAGKSTLLHILGMLDEPSEGQYFFDGEPVHKLNEKKEADFIVNISDLFSRPTTYWMISRL